MTTVTLHGDEPLPQRVLDAEREAHIEAEVETLARVLYRAPYQRGLWKQAVSHATAAVAAGYRRDVTP